MKKLVKLDNRSVLSISGPDSLNFLQGVSTNDMYAKEHIIYSAVLNNRGKILYDFFLYKNHNSTHENTDMLLECNTLYLEDFIKYLNKYKLRSDVDFSLAPKCQVFSSSEIREGLYLDPRSKKLGYRGILDLQDIMSMQDQGGAEYHETRVKALIPEFGIDFKPADFFPFELGIQEYGISYDKGCYIGQEVVARTHYTGHVRKKVFLIEVADIDSVSSNLQYGAVLVCDGVKIGKMLGRIRNFGLALLYEDRVQGILNKVVELEGFSEKVQIHFGYRL